MAALTASLRLSYRGTREGIPRIVDNRGAHADARANALLTAKTTAGPGCQADTRSDTPRDRNGRVKAQARGPTVRATP